MATEFDRTERRRLQDAADEGALVGMVGGGAGGYYGVKAGERLSNGHARRYGKAGYKLSRGVGQGRLRAVKNGVQTAGTAVRAARTTPWSAAGMAGAYLGGVGGAVVGSQALYRHEKKKIRAEHGVTKSSSISAFGIDHG